MTESRDARRHIEQLIERAQDELLDASRQLADGISKGGERVVPPLSHDLERLVDEVFDFTERVIKGQRKMVGDIVRAINEQSRRAAEVGRETTARVAKRAPAKKPTAARRARAKKATAAKRVPAKKAATTGRAVAKKATG
ncbi:MAG: hypothetical protein ABSC41_14995 [Acidimicrobiales bacterium]